MLATSYHHEKNPSFIVSKKGFFKHGSIPVTIETLLMIEMSGYLTKDCVLASSLLPRRNAAFINPLTST